VSLDDKRVQIYHLEVIVEKVHDRLASNRRRQRGDRCEYRSFRHDGAMVRVYGRKKLSVLLRSSLWE
jgi:hypothetical protein